MNTALYDKEVNCPICNNAFHTKKVRSSALRIEKKDTDFCVYYTSENPMFYTVWVCPSCGYAALESIFQQISNVGKKQIMTNISNNWVQRSFGGERTVREAIEAYKLALLCGQLTNAQKGVLGTICLRLGWLHRYIGEDRELAFLQHAVSCFEEAFRYEALPLGNLGEIEILYLLGELNRRLQKYEEAIDWFNKAVSNPAIKRKRSLDVQTREQWQLAKEAYRIQKKEEQVG
ncbi:DUF2225 domain-containing protein [Clostridiaceae bacterium 35-E11]